MNTFGCRMLVGLMLFASLGGCAGVIMHPQVVTKPSNAVAALPAATPPAPSIAAKSVPAPVKPSVAVAVVVPPEPEFWADVVAARRFTDCSYDPAIETWAQRLTQSPANFNANLVRIQPYLDYVWRRTQALQMPSEIAFLPLVESDYRQVYGSYGSPGGWWQLMPATARGYRLDVSRGNDERIDPIKSTDVALKLMQENALRFDNDWLLAIFAYNAGGQRVQRVLSANGIKPGQVEHVRQLGLSLTTENHLHRLIAWGCIFANPARYQVTLPPPLLASQRLTEVRLAHTTPVAAIVATLDGYGAEWKSQHPLIAKVGQIRYAQSVLARPQTNAELAAMGNLQRFNSATPVLAALHTRSAAKPHTAVLANQARQQTVSTSARVNSALVNSTLVNRKLAAPTSFKVRNGDNLWTIARRFDMRVNEILALNPSVSRDTVLKLGHVLRLK